MVVHIPELGEQHPLAFLPRTQLPGNMKAQLKVEVLDAWQQQSGDGGSSQAELAELDRQALAALAGRELQVGAGR